MAKGRNKELLELRDKALYERYQYLTEVKHLRFDYVLSILSQKEFFLSESRIMAIIRKHVQSL